MSGDRCSFSQFNTAPHVLQKEACEHGPRRWVACYMDNGDGYPTPDPDFAAVALRMLSGELSASSMPSKEDVLEVLHEVAKAGTVGQAEVLDLMLNAGRAVEIVGLNGKRSGVKAAVVYVVGDKYVPVVVETVKKAVAGVEGRN